MSGMPQRVASTGRQELHDLSGCSRVVSGIFTPLDRRELLQLLKSASSSGIQFHPFSCGKNWGFGSRLPVSQNAHLVDLSNLRAIKLNLDQDYAEVEPGVTQGDLYDALLGAGDSHYFNVTGAGRSTSVLGNALERGIGYFGSRKDDLLDLEIASMDGELFWSKDQPANPHHTGLGPDLTGLFLQSGWGVVTTAQVRLRKKPPYMGAFLLQLKPNSSVQDFLDQITLLCREGLITSVPHIANRSRMIGTFGPYLPAEQISALSKSAAEWSCLAPVGGSKGTVSALFELIQQRMEATANCRLLDHETAKSESFLAPAIDLALGKPNDFALPGVSFSALGKASLPVGDLDSGDFGLIHVTPTCPSTSSAMDRLLGLIDQVRCHFEIAPLAMTVNLVNPGTAAVIISIPFNRQEPDGLSKAKSFSAALTHACSRAGFVPYRLGLEDSVQLAPMNPSRRQILQKIEDSIGTREMIAPSRYSSSWSEAPALPHAPLTKIVKLPTEVFA